MFTEKGPTKEPDDIKPHEPYLGFWWSFYILIIYAIRETFPTTPFTFWWYAMWYMTLIVFTIAVVTVYKRYLYSRGLKKESSDKNLANNK